MPYAPDYEQLIQPLSPMGFQDPERSDVPVGELPPNPLLEMVQQKKQQELQPQSEAYDPTGKTVEQIYAETGRQGELDQMGFTTPQLKSVPGTQGGTFTMQSRDITPVTPEGVPTVTQAYGNKNPIEKYSGGVNLGTDFRADEGTELRTPQGKWIVESAQPGWNQGSGNLVKIRNDKGESMAFEHLSKLEVQSGQELQPGQVLGLSGNTGNSTGPHASIPYKNEQGQYQDVLDTPYAQDVFGAPKKAEPGQLPTSGYTEEGVTVEAPSLKTELKTALEDQVKFEDEQLTQGLPKSTAEILTEAPEATPSAQVNEQFYQSLPSNLQGEAKKTAPLIIDALKAEGITDPAVIGYALATAEHESGFKPKSEVMASRGKNARNDYIANLQDNYEGGRDYHGRGLIQLTHKGNYEKYGKRIGEDLVSNPDRLLDPEVSSKVLAAYIKDAGVADAVTAGDYDQARVRVQGRGALNSQFIGNTREITRKAQEWAGYF